MIHEMKHRIFVALNISKEFQKKILEWENGFQGRAPETAKKIRWLAGENLHITIILPWYEDDEGIEKVKQALNSISGGGESFDCFFENVSYGPNFDQPRLAWLLGKTPSQFMNLKNRIIQALKIKTENRPFLLHLTIGRFRSGDFSSFSIKNLNEPFKFKEMIKEFALIESHLARDGARYEVIEKFRV